MLKVSEVAEMLHVSGKTVTRWIDEGKIEAYRFGKDYRIKQDALDRFLEESRVTPKEPGEQN